MENCQAVFIWERASRVPNSDIVHIGGTLNKVVHRTTGKKIKFWAEYGKGSANTLIEWTPANSPPNAEPWRLVISSAHVDSKSATKRASQIAEIMEAASTLGPKASGTSSS